MNWNNWLTHATCFCLLFGCASRQQAVTIKPSSDSAQTSESTSTPANIAPDARQKSVATPLLPKSNVRAVKSADGLVDGEIVGIPAPSSKFYKLQIGMKQTQVENLIGQPDRTDSRVTGKQFQPFYFGGDTQRTEVFYKHDGQLTFSNTQVDSAADTLIRIAVDPDAGESR